MRYSVLSQAIALLPCVAAHGRITRVTTTDGTTYPGWNPELLEGDAPRPDLVAWSANNLGNGYISPSGYTSANIACHFNARPGALHVNTTAGESLTVRWNEWPTSHVGPVLDYLARCDGDCSTADKNKLEWVRIGELGWLNETNWDLWGLGGTWATDVLIRNGFQWTIKVPETLEEGNYVLRHEIIALHVAEKMYGAQSYPQCVNLRVSRDSSGGSKGVLKLEGGVLGSKLYKPEDKGIFVDVHQNIKGYEIPGPKLWSGAEKILQPGEQW